MNLSNAFSINPTHSNSNPRNSSSLKYHYFWRCLEFVYAAVNFFIQYTGYIVSHVIPDTYKFFYLIFYFLFIYIGRKCGSWKLTVTTNLGMTKQQLRIARYFSSLFFSQLQIQQNWWLRNNYMNLLEDSWNFY